MTVVAQAENGQQAIESFRETNRILP